VRATIDTSAWVSVVLSRLSRAEPIVDALRSGQVTLVASEPTFAETAEVLERPRLNSAAEDMLQYGGS
jgi:predicted nucleic acid-binding protein